MNFLKNTKKNSISSLVDNNSSYGFIKYHIKLSLYFYILQISQYFICKKENHFLHLCLFFTLISNKRNQDFISLLSLQVRDNTYPNSYCVIGRWSQERQLDSTGRHCSHLLDRSSKPFLIWRKVRWNVFWDPPVCSLMSDFTLFFSNVKTNVFSHNVLTV